MATTIFHFELKLGEGDNQISLHSYYTALEALIISNVEEMTVSRSTLQKWSAKAEQGEKYEHKNWIIRKGVATTTKEAREQQKLLDDWADEGFPESS